MTEAVPATADHAIPLVDLGWQHRQVADEVWPRMRAVADRTAFVLGPEVEQFEEDFARYSGVRHCAGVANGTDAVELALRALGIGAGDEVVVPANTFVASAAGVVRAGASPVFVDCDAEYLLLDPDAVRAAVGPRTAAVLPVHLYGQMAPMRALVDLCRPAGLALVEDAAQSQGATHDGKGTGVLSSVAATSFYPGKNLGAFGDAGAVLTDATAVDDRVRRLRNHGGTHRYEHVERGTNSRLDTLQAVVLSAKLACLEQWNDLRRQAAERYEGLLGGLPEVRTPGVAPGNQHVWHLYVVRVPNRDRVLAALAAAGVGAGLHYPQPLHRLAPYVNERAADCPVAESSSTQILSLPLYPGITAEQQERVVTALAAAVTGRVAEVR